MGSVPKWLYIDSWRLKVAFNSIEGIHCTAISSHMYKIDDYPTIKNPISFDLFRKVTKFIGDNKVRITVEDCCASFTIDNFRIITNHLFYNYLI